MKDESIAAKLLFAKSAITNALSNDNVKNAMSLFGYDETTLQAGLAIQQSASDLQERQVKEYEEQFAATDDLNQSRIEANRSYVKHLKIARIALKGNPNAEKSLGLGGRRKESFSGWLSQAKTYYANALSSAGFLAAMAK